MASAGIGIGLTLFGIPVAYSIFKAVFFGIDVLGNPIFWVALGLAIVAGIAGAVNVIESGLNATGTKLSFISALGLSIYGTMINPSFVGTGIPEPYITWLTVALTSMYAIGLFAIMAES